MTNKYSEIVIPMLLYDIIFRIWCCITYFICVVCSNPKWTLNICEGHIAYYIGALD